MDQLEETHYFSTPVYLIKKPEFLDLINPVSEHYLNHSKSVSKKDGSNSLVTMTSNYHNEPSIALFSEYVNQTAWNILSAQGYDMKNLVTYFTEMWTHEHDEYSYMEKHIHGSSSQISAFYFLEAPENGSKFCIFDPRESKTIVGLPSKNDMVISQSSNQIVFTPSEGMLIMTNSWLPHSFTQNRSKKPFKFVHMNISVAVKQQPEVEIV